MLVYSLAKCVAFLSGRNELWVSNAETLEVYNLQTYEKIRILAHSFGTITSLAADENQNIVSGSLTGEVVLWNSEQYEVDCTLSDFNLITEVTALAAQDGQIVSGTADGTLVLWNVPKKEQQWDDAHSGPVNSMVLHDGRLWTVSVSDAIKVWELETSRCFHNVNLSKNARTATLWKCELPSGPSICCLTEVSVQVFDATTSMPQLQVALSVSPTKQTPINDIAYALLQTSFQQQQRQQGINNKYICGGNDDLEGGEVFVQFEKAKIAMQYLEEELTEQQRINDDLKKRVDYVEHDIDDCQRDHQEVLQKLAIDHMNEGREKELQWNEQEEYLQSKVDTLTAEKAELESKLHQNETELEQNGSLLGYERSLNSQLQAEILELRVTQNKHAADAKQAQMEVITLRTKLNDLMATIGDREFSEDLLLSARGKFNSCGDMSTVTMDFSENESCQGQLDKHYGAERQGQTSRCSSPNSLVHSRSMLVATLWSMQDPLRLAIKSLNPIVDKMEKAFKRGDLKAQDSYRLSELERLRNMCMERRDKLQDTVETCFTEDEKLHFGVNWSRSVTSVRRTTNENDNNGTPSPSPPPPLLPTTSAYHNHTHITSVPMQSYEYTKKLRRPTSTVPPQSTSSYANTPRQRSTSVASSANNDRIRRVQGSGERGDDHQRTTVAGGGTTTTSGSQLYGQTTATMTTTRKRTQTSEGRPTTIHTRVPHSNVDSNDNILPCCYGDNKKVIRSRSCTSMGGTNNRGGGGGQLSDGCSFSSIKLFEGTSTTNHQSTATTTQHHMSRSSTPASVLFNSVGGGSYPSSRGPTTASRSSSRSTSPSSYFTQPSYHHSSGTNDTSYHDSYYHRSHAPAVSDYHCPPPTML